MKSFFNLREKIIVTKINIRKTSLNIDEALEEIDIQE